MTEPGNAGVAGSGAGAESGAIPEETLKRALHAFKKRLKLTKLDQESKIQAHRPMTSGKKSDVMGIIPPNDFPRTVWAELAQKKLLKDMGGGFYSLP